MRMDVYDIGNLIVWSLVFILILARLVRILG